MELLSTQMEPFAHSNTKVLAQNMTRPLPQKGLDIAGKNSHGILGTETPQTQIKSKPYILSDKWDYYPHLWPKKQ